MSKPIPFTYTGKALTFLYQGKTTIIGKDATNFELVVKELKAGHWDEVARLANLRTVITVLSEGRVKINDDDTVWVEGKEVQGTVVDRILEMLKDGFGVLPYVHFLDNVEQNPSADSKQDLYGFIEANSLPLTEDGYFLGYKIVNSAYMDIYTTTISNRIGEKPKMDREKVNANRNETCSTGLHVCSEGYLPHYGREGNGDRVIIVKVHPKDVVSVPTDYNNAKMRVCAYEVVDELVNWQERIKSFFTPQYSSYSSVGEPEVDGYAGHITAYDLDVRDNEDLEDIEDDEEEDDFFEEEDLDDESEDETDIENVTETNESNLDGILAKLTYNTAVSSDVVPTEKIEQIRKVRKMSADGWTRTAIADAVGLSRRQVGRILDGEAWSHIQ